MKNPRQHIGQFIREKVIPEELSIREAAEMLGVQRPTLSKLLNGKSTLSKGMAIKLEKTFGASRDEILAMQSKSEIQEADALSTQLHGGFQLPSFQPILAREIESWAGRISAREKLAAFLRRLVNSTTTELTRSNFPAFDNSQRKGWDGQTDALHGSLWVPQGKAGWEFGTNVNVSSKANDDYRQRTKDVSETDRANTTFVFATPRNWKQGQNWAEQRRLEGDWKDVRVLDASDLEQWIETSATTHCWMAEELQRPHEGISSLDNEWTKWAGVTDPELREGLFDGQKELHSKGLNDWLNSSPIEPYDICADSIGEVLAFLAAVLGDDKVDQTIVVGTASGVTGLRNVDPQYLIVVSTREAEMELANLHRSHHVVIARTNDSTQMEPNIQLGTVDDKTFRSALKEMGLQRDQIETLERDTGRSLTVLRRRMSVIQGISTPPWADNNEIIEKLIPALLAGAWNSATPDDCEILKYLCQYDSYNDLESDILELLKQDQSPVWSAGSHRGVSNKLDTFFAISPSISETHIDNFLFVANFVLSEDDPSYDLSRDKRWAADIYGKSRNYSSTLRTSILQSLVFLAVHGPNLFRNRFGSSIESKMSKTVKSLLTPLSERRWFSQRGNLRHYAEASPETFMEILNEDLGSSEPTIHSLFEPAESGPFGDCQRTNLLWGLEIIAWKPLNFDPVIKALSDLANIQIDDNWVNKPINTLQSIFRSWMPQTSATMTQRKKALADLLEDNRDIGLQLCLDQFKPGSDVGTYNVKPSWRMDAFGHGEVVSIGDRADFALHAFNLVVDLAIQSVESLSGLIQSLEAIGEEERQDVWNLVQSWASSNPTEEERAVLREVVRVSALSSRGRSKDMTEADFDTATRTYELLEPVDKIQRHLWLFEKDWIDETFDELNDETDWEFRDKRINDQRISAIREIVSDLELSGLVELLHKGGTPYLIGRLVAQDSIFDNILQTMTSLIELSSPEIDEKVNLCIHGLFSAIGTKAYEIILEAVALGKPSEDSTYRRLLLCSPFTIDTWKIVDGLPQCDQSFYWQEVAPSFFRRDDQDANIIADKLMDANRSDVALNLLSHSWKELDTKRIIEILENVGQGNKISGEPNRVQSYYISDALEVIEKRGDTDAGVLAQLEFMYIGVLDHTKHGVKNLEKQLANDPSMFAYMLARTFKRDDDGDDPEEWRANDPKQSELMATAAYSLLERAKYIPGQEEDGSVKIEELRNWVNSARTACREIARSTIGDQKIGSLLSSSVSIKDAMPPDSSICAVMQEIGSEEMATGFVIGIRNSRGVTWRGEGGDQERELSAKYRDWASQLIEEFPFMSKVFDTVAKQYDHDAEWHDNRSTIRQKLER
jgi:addiction module HigA family antidote